MHELYFAKVSCDIFLRENIKEGLQTYLSNLDACSQWNELIGIVKAARKNSISSRRVILEALLNVCVHKGKGIAETIIHGTAKQQLRAEANLENDPLSKNYICSLIDNF